MARAAVNSSEFGIENFPEVLANTDHTYDIAGVSFLIILYAFMGLAIVCEEYLMPALIEISYRLNMTIVMADATLIAFGTTLPELCICIISILVARTDAGYCTIIGSVAFDSFAAVGMCGLIAKEPFGLDWWTTTRDLSTSCLALIPLVIMLGNGNIAMIESALLILTYCIYITYMYFDKIIQERLRDFSETKQRTGTKCYRTDPEIVPNMYEKYIKYEGDGLDNLFNPLRWPKTTFSIKFLWILSWPLQVLMILTIPDCRRKCARSCYVLTVLMSVIWVALLSYIVMWCSAILSFHFNIPTAIVGLTLLGCGSAAADIFSCVMMVREANSARGVYYVLAMNNIKMLFYLGLAYLLESSAVCFWPKEFQTFAMSAQITYITVFLCIGFFIIYFLLLFTNFVINRWIGCILILIYLIYITICCLIKMQMFEALNKSLWDQM